MENSGKPSPTSARFRAVLFDLDGTLLDTLQDIADSCNAALQQQGFPAHPVAAYKTFVGDGVFNLIKRTLPSTNRDQATMAEVLLIYRQEYARRWNATTRPYEGVPSLLDELTKKDVTMAVLSNKPDDFTRQCVDELLPKWKFAAVLGASAGFAHKPDPAGALHIAGMLKLDPTSFAYLGDTATDMQTAVAAGMYPVGALWGFRSLAELVESGAKATISQPRDLLTLIA